MTQSAIIAAAEAWHAAIEAGTADIDALTDWLVADPAHSSALDAIALADAMLDDHASQLARMVTWPPLVEAPGEPDPAGIPAASAVWPTIVAANDDHASVAAARPMWSMRWAGGLVSGALAAALAVVALVPHPQAPVASQWRSGDAPRTVALADGTTVVLAPDSQLDAAGDQLTLTGSGVFTVPHRPQRTLTITAGHWTISDIGTRFDLRVDPAGMRVALAEGEVTVRPAPGSATASSTTAGHAVSLGARNEGGITVHAGEALIAAGAAAPRVMATTPSTVGDWQDGLLTYRDTPMALVAADLVRYGHSHWVLPAALSEQHFSGTLRFGHGHDPASDLARLLGPDAARSSPGQPATAH